MKRGKGRSKAEWFGGGRSSNPIVELVSLIVISVKQVTCQIKQFKHNFGGRICKYNESEVEMLWQEGEQWWGERCRKQNWSLVGDEEVWLWTFGLVWGGGEKNKATIRASYGFT